jgi:ethanolamine utilization protein EutM
VLVSVKSASNRNLLFVLNSAVLLSCGSMIRPALGLIETTGLTGALQATHAATSAGDVAIASAVRTEAGRMAVKIEGDWSAVQKAVEAGARAADAVGELVAMHVIPRTDQDLSRILPYHQFLARFLESSPHPVAAAKPTPLEPKPKPTARTRAPQVTKSASMRKSRTAGTTHPSRDSERVEVRKIDHPTSPLSVTETTTSSGIEMPSMSELEGLSVVNLRRWARGVPGFPIQGRQISMANKQQLLEAIRSWRAATEDGS